MTNEQLETAARKLCEIRQLPADNFPLRDGSSFLDIAKREILAFYQVAKALDSVIGSGELK